MGNNIKMRYIILLFMLTIFTMFALANQEADIQSTPIMENIAIDTLQEDSEIEDKEETANDSGVVERNKLTFGNISVSSDYLKSYFSEGDKNLELTGNILLQIKNVSNEYVNGTVKIRTDKLFITDNMTVLKTDSPIEIEFPLIYTENSPPILNMLATANSFYYNANAVDDENILLVDNFSTKTYNGEGNGITHLKLKANSFSITGVGVTVASKMKLSIFGMNVASLNKYSKKSTNTESFFDFVETPEINYRGRRGLIINYKDDLNITDNLRLHHHLGYSTKMSFDWLLSLDYYNKVSNIPIKVSLIESSAEYDTGNQWMTGEIYDDYNFAKLKVNRTPVLNVKNAEKIKLFDTVYTDISLGGGTFYENLSGTKDNMLYGILNVKTKDIGLINDGLNLSLYGGARYANYDRANENTFTTIYGAKLGTDVKKQLYLGTSYTMYDQTGDTPFMFDKLFIEDLLRFEGDYKLKNKLGTRLSVNAAYSYSPSANKDVSREIGFVYSDYVMSYTLKYNTLNNGISFGIVLNNNFSFRNGGGTFNFPFQN